MRKNHAERGRPQMIIRPMLIAPWIPRATNTYTQVVLILITFPLQQWLQERASMLCYTHIACLVYMSVWSSQIFDWHKFFNRVHKRYCFIAGMSILYHDLNFWWRITEYLDTCIVLSFFIFSDVKIWCMMVIYMPCV